MKNKKNLIISLILLLSIGTTLAFFTSTSTLENEFKSGKYKTVSTDNFTSPSDWAPGDTTSKTITTKNEGTLPVRVRVKLEEEWESENGDSLPLEFNSEPVAIINLDNEEDWVKDGDYYYYIDILNPGDTTSSLIESVTYNPITPSDMECTSTNGVYNCVSTGDGYDGATYTLNIIVETVQSDAVISAWNLSYDPTEESYAYTSSYVTNIENGTNITTLQTEEDFASTGKDVFLRFKVFGRIIKQTDLGIIVDNNDYYLKGGVQYIEENRNTLISAFGSDRCTTIPEEVINCFNDEVTATVYLTDGRVSGVCNVENLYCQVYDENDEIKPFCSPTSVT